MESKRSWRIIALTALVIIILLGAAMWSIYELTDGTDAGTVSLIQHKDTDSGYFLAEVRPKVLNYKDGGLWADSPFVDGRYPVDRKFQNITESHTLFLKGDSADEAIRNARLLKNLLEKAFTYWTTSWQTDPVWIKRQAKCADYPEYAVVMGGQIPEEANPFSQPFMQPGGRALMDSINAIIEHGPWLDHEIGDSTCIQLAGKEDSVLLNTTSVVRQIAQSSDDVSRQICSGCALNLVGNRIYLGYVVPVTVRGQAGLRFQNITIPQGSIILDAYIGVQATDDDSVDICRVKIYGQDADDPATFSTTPDFLNRLNNHKTSAYVTWTIPHWATNAGYFTPTLREIVQEIIDRPGWASGNDMAFLFVDFWSTQNTATRRFYSWDNESTKAATLYITYLSSSSVTFGRAATCEDEVYVSNKDNTAQLTHIYRYDSSLATWSANLIEETDYALFPTDPVGDDDCIYFITEMTGDMIETGPFDNLVFDIGTAAIYDLDTVTIVWEYWNGANWVAPTIMQDNTEDLLNNGPFALTGVHGVFWLPRIAWAESTINHPIDGAITGYMIRARCDMTDTDTVSCPYQQNRKVYTTNWNSVLLQGSQVPGDLPALTKIKITNVSDSDGPEFEGVAPTYPTWTNRIIIASRSTSRGALFTTFLNLFDAAANGTYGDQNPEGIYFEELDHTTDWTWSHSNQYNYYPVGRRDLWQPAGLMTAFDDIATLNFSYGIARQWLGAFRVFFLADQVAGDDDRVVDVKLDLRVGGAANPTTIWTSREDTVQKAEDYGIYVMDLGLMNFPKSCLLELSDYPFQIVLQAKHTSSNENTSITPIGLVLMPADEWIADLTDAEPDYGWLGIDSYYRDMSRRYLVIDSLTHPKIPLSAAVYENYADLLVIPQWISVSGGQAQLQHDAEQRLHVFALQHDSSADDAAYFDWRWITWAAHKIQAWRVSRYRNQVGDAYDFSI